MILSNLHLVLARRSATIRRGPARSLASDQRLSRLVLLVMRLFRPFHPALCGRRALGNRRESRRTPRLRTDALSCPEAHPVQSITTRSFQRRSDDMIIIPEHRLLSVCLHLHSGGWYDERRAVSQRRLGRAPTRDPARLPLISVIRGGRWVIGQVTRAAVTNGCSILTRVETRGVRAATDRLPRHCRRVERGADCHCSVLRGHMDPPIKRPL